MKTDRVKSVFLGTVAIVLSIFGTGCFLQRAGTDDNFKQDLTLAAAALMMPQSDDAYRDVFRQEASPDAEDTESPAETTSASTFDQVIPPENTDLHEDEVHYSVIETRFGESGVSCDNFYIKDSVGAGTDFDELLNLPMGFDFSNNKEVQVLIYHTHTTESYLEYDEGYYHESFYPRSEDETKNMISVGEKIAESLRAQGIGVIHAREVHDSPEYTGAYDRSWETITKYMEQYPSIKVVLDIHRDSIAGDNSSKVKPTFEVNGRKAAQIMIMAGCDSDGSYGFPDWEYNLRFALKLQKYAEDMYPGMTRPLYFGNFAYNMPVSRGSLLIEVGTDVNTVYEAQYTGELLGNVLAKVLQSEG